MKRVLCLLVALMLFHVGFAAAEDDCQALRQTQEEFVLDALKALATYGIDQCNQSYLVPYFEKESTAWVYTSKFDKGLYPDVRSFTFSDLSTENWTKVSDTEYTVDAIGTLTAQLVAQSHIEVYPCRYRFFVHMTSKGWRVSDFETLPSPEDEATAERLSALRPGVHFEAITGTTFRGFLMTVDDPADLCVGTCDYFGKDAYGLEASAMAERYRAFAVVNGGGFSDTMKGGRPYGVVVTRGRVRQAHNQYDDTATAVVAVTQDDKLAIGTFTEAEFQQLNARDAVAFNPLLIDDGVEVGKDTRDHHGWYTIRTVVAKDEEGRALFLIIKGRQSDSLGATTKDVTRLLLSRGVVDAANMDGGTSTALYVNGEIIYSGYRFWSSRPLPTAFIIGAGVD